MLWASLLADGAHQLAEVELPDPRQALLSMPTWAVVATTILKFVTGTHKQASKHVNPKTKRLHTGVGQDEYHAVIQEHWVPLGNRLFQQAGKWADNWQLQQDNAPPHKTAQNMAYITAIVPGGHFLKWPANSPDLSPFGPGWITSCTSCLYARIRKS
ncbi:TPA: hypothetical protein ACH3X1_008499 [Trebouxia sp. C0004]